MLEPVITDMAQAKAVDGAPVPLQKLLDVEKNDEDKRISFLSTFSLPQLRLLAIELVAHAKTRTSEDGKPIHLGFLASHGWIMNVNVGSSQLIQQINLVLKSCCKNEDSTSALDKTFSDQNLKIKAIIQELNTNKLSKYRYTELLNQNFFDTYEGKVINAKTLIVYAVADLSNTALEKFLKELKIQISSKQLGFYLDMPIVIDGHKTTLEEWFLRGGYTAENEDEADLEITKKIVEKYIKIGRRENTEPINLANVGTHTSSAHHSADISHIKAFVRMLELEPNLNVKLEYHEFTKNNNTEDPRKVTITNSEKLNEFVQNLLYALRVEIHLTQHLPDVVLYEKYYATKNVKDIFSSAPEQLKKVKFFRFQILAALRYINEIIHYHSCGEVQESGYTYRTNLPSSCGLTMEQMIATAYYLGVVDVKDVEALYQLILALYDIKRGYDIDNGIDKPDLYEMPENTVDIKDSNRCYSGSINSLIDSLLNIHPAYEKVILDRQSIKNELRNIYNEIATNNDADLNDKMSYAQKIIWNVSGRVTGEGRKLLYDLFKPREKEFREAYQKWIPDQIFEGILLSAADNVKMPKSLMSKYTIEAMEEDEILLAIENNSFPTLYYDEKSGYTNILQYIAKLKKDNALIDTIVKRALNNALLRKYDAIRYLVNSDIDSQYVVCIFGKDYAINLLKGLNIRSLAILFSSATLEELLKNTMENNLSSLFAWYWKKIGFEKEDYKKHFGPNGLTILHWAVGEGYLEIVKDMLGCQEGRDAIEVKDNNGRTSLYVALGRMHLEIIKELLIHSESVLNISLRNNDGHTLLHWAAKEGLLPIVKAILTHQEGRDSIKAKDNDGRTPLHLAAIRGHIEIVKEVLRHPECSDIIKIQDSYGYILLHWTIGKERLELLKVMLTHPQCRDMIKMVDKNKQTLLHWAVIDRDLDVVKAILSHPECRDIIKIKDNNEATPVYLAMRLGYVEVIKEMLRHAECSDIFKMQDMDHNNLLHWAVTEGYLEIVKELLNHQEGRYLVKEKNNTGDTPLHWAITEGDLEIIIEIISHPECRDAISIQDRDGDTALHIAISVERLDIVKAILTNPECRDAITIANNNGKIPFYVTDAYGETLIHLLVIEGDLDVLKMILSYPECRHIIQM